MKATSVRLTIGAFALLAVSAVSAQTRSLLRVNIPFNFVVAGQKMAAGEYTVQESGEAGILILNCAASGKSVLVLGEPVAARSAANSASLSFERHSGDVYLVRVQEASGPSRMVPMKEHTF